MGRDKFPKFQAHSSEVARHANHPDQQAIEKQHVDGAQSGGDAESEGHKPYAHVVGHDGARGERFDADNRMRPHLVLLDGLHHLWAEDTEFKVGVLESKSSTNQGRHRKDGECNLYKPQIAPNNLRIEVTAKKPRIATGLVLRAE